VVHGDLHELGHVQPTMLDYSQKIQADLKAIGINATTMPGEFSLPDEIPGRSVPSGADHHRPSGR
jgi:hypothetical protein